MFVASGSSFPGVLPVGALAMDRYPADFPQQSRAAVAAEKLRAGKDFDKARDNPPRMPYGLAQYQEAELRKYILRPFGVFVREACKLGQQGIWQVDRIEEEALEFLRISTIYAAASKGYDKSGHAFARNWIGNWGGHIEPEVQRQFERSEEWQQFQQALLEVAESQEAQASDMGADAKKDLSQDTPLGRNLDRMRLECGWSFDELAAATKLDKKLILGHINKGKKTYPSTLATYGSTFTQKLGRPVTVAELEA